MPVIRILPQAKVNSATFWQSEAHRLGVNFVAVKGMGELYDLATAGDKAMGRLRHCAYFVKPLNYQGKPSDDDEWEDWPEDAPADCDCIAVAEALKVMGNAALKGGELDRAVYKYAKALRYLHLGELSKMDVSDASQAVRVACMMNTALCLSKQSKHSECISQCAEAIEIEPENAKAFYRKGSAHLAMNDHTMAEADLLRALELSPDDKAIKAELAKVAKFWKKLQKEEARMAKKMFG